MSAYSEVEYLREAMKLGCCDYILKPIDEYELEDTLRRTISAIQGENEQARLISRNNEQLEQLSLYHYMTTGQGWWGKNPASRDLWLNREPYTVFMLQMNSHSIDEYVTSSQVELLRTGYISNIIRTMLGEICDKFLFFDYEEGIWTAILPLALTSEKAAAAGKIRDGLEEEMGLHVNVCFSLTGHRTEELPGLYEDVESLCKYSFYVGEEQILGHGYNCDKREFDQVCSIGRLKDIDQAVKSADWNMLRCVLSDAFQLSDGYNPGALENVYELAYQTVLSIRKNQEAAFAASEFSRKEASLGYEKLRSVPSVRQLKELLWSLVDAVEKQKNTPGSAAGKSAPHYSRPVEKSLEILEENYNCNLSLDEICSQIAVSKNYFCYLFKREVGTSLWNYLTEIRVRHAKELLKKQI